ncbi:MAG: hypothetical protein Q9187_002689 [Circinaria calcarea]
MSPESAPARDEPPLASSNDVAPQTEDGLDQGSYTAHRLQHAPPEHLHITSRRCFIGPIPLGWLKNNKSWYKRQLPTSRYSSRAATFSADTRVSHKRQITGLDGPSAAAIYGHSFPQPEDIDENATEDEDENNGGNGVEIDTGTGVKQASNQDAQDTSNNYQDNNHPTLTTQSSQAKNTSGTTLTPSNMRKVIPSFITARENRVEEPVNFALIETKQDRSKYLQPSAITEETTGSNGEQAARFSIASSFQDPSRSAGEPSKTGDATTSKSSLLPHGRPDIRRSISTEDSAANLTTDATTPTSKLRDAVPEEYLSSQVDLAESAEAIPLPASLVRFNLPDGLAQDEVQVKAKKANFIRRGSLKQLRRDKLSPGEIVKMEKMLVRVDYTMHELPPDYDENDSLKAESRLVEKWREFVIVCRKGSNENNKFMLQMYKTRVIPEKEHPNAQKSYAYSIPLERKTTKLNLYSSLDKTIVIWIPWKTGTRTYLLRPQSPASGVEWYTFLRSTLGWKRSEVLQVNVPDLDITVQLDNPFEELENTRNAAQNSREDMTAIMKTMALERVVASSIIARCMKILEKSPEWGDVVRIWLSHEKMGLAWKRFDRLEWVYGANEQKMYGTLAMQKTHDLELRPKQHYPTTISTDGGSSREEPAPVEGFLIRLTSQKGRDQRFGKRFSKRLYFSTHNQFLCFCRPARAIPPPPPTTPDHHGNHVRTAIEIADKLPFIYAVNPYPVEKGQLAWLMKTNAAQRRYHDQNAHDEAERKVNALLQTEGYINLCHVTRVRHVRKQSPATDQAPSQEPYVHGDEDGGDTSGNSTSLGQDEIEQSFELLLRNGLVVRLQAYDKVTKNAWMVRLRQLTEYWKIRIAEDVKTYKIVRQMNLERLNIDEEMESALGQFAQKWEVSRSVASPQLFNMCGISCCRAITVREGYSLCLFVVLTLFQMAGVLYRKPRTRSTFQRCSVILCHGQLLIFQGTLRRSTGKEVPHVHNELQQALDLKNCYIYSGLITEGDLLYQNRTFDSNHPGRHALPRVYLEDNWTSSDDDTATCFVIWSSQRKSFFMTDAEEAKGKTRRRLTYVSRLGVTGRSTVFKTRSRAERDRWVMSIGMEIERLHQDEEIRVIPDK